MKLYITEKKSVADAFIPVLGKKSSSQLSYTTNDGSIVTWLSGHVLELIDAKDYDEKYAKWNLDNLPILPEPFILRPSADKKSGSNVVVNNSFKRKILQNALDLIGKASEVVLATDPDAEGELLGREVIEYSGFKGTLSRILPTSLEVADIKKTIASQFPAEKTELVGMSGLARSHIDWIVGINSTVALTAYNQDKIDRPLNCGRVQTAIINILHRNHVARTNFVAQPVYSVMANAYVDGNELELKYTATADEKVVLDPKSDNYDPIAAKSLVDDLASKLAGKDGKVTSCEKTRKITGCPKGFSLSDLQIEVGKKHGISATDTLASLQSLYDKKFVTYPRTDNNYFPEDAHAHAPTILENLQDFSFAQDLSGLDANRKNAYWDTSKFDNHHAIMPTRSKIVKSALTPDELCVYETVAKRYLTQFMPDYLYDRTAIEVDVSGSSFKTSGNIMVDLGWKQVLSKSNTQTSDADEDKDEDDGKSLPVVEQGTTTSDTNIFTTEGSTKIPPFYTESTLLQALQNPAKFIEEKALVKILKEREKGIGRESTRASILNTMLQNEFYSIQKKKSVVLTEKGLVIADIAPPMLLDLALTAKLEQSFADIESGKITYNQLLAEYKQSTRDIIESVRRGECALKKYLVKTAKCLNCDTGTLTQRNGKDREKYWRCASCSSSFPDNKGKPVPRAPKESCPKCKKLSLGRFIFKDSKDIYGWYCRQCKTSLPEIDLKPALKIHSCVKCTAQLNYGYSSLKKVHYFRCTDQKCGSFYSYKDGVPEAPKDVSQVMKTEPCNKCKDGKLRQFTRKSDGTKFWLCSNQKVAEVNCQASYDDKNDKPDIHAKEYNCPSCKVGLLKRRNYKDRYFHGCTNWNHPKLQCKFTAQDKDGAPVLILN